MTPADWIARRIKAAQWGLQTVAWFFVGYGASKGSLGMVAFGVSYLVMSFVVRKFLHLKQLSGDKG